MERSRYKTPIGINLSERQFLITDQRENPIYNDEGEILIGAPLDSQSITWKHLGTLPYGTQFRAGIEQLMHPEIGAAVEYKSKFWNDPYRRIAVSMDPIMSVSYAKDQNHAGARVRGFHEGIHGTDEKGRHFNALSRGAFYWAHETFRYGVEAVADHYSKDQLTRADREQLSLESTTWYSRYGMPMNMVPADYQANLDYRKYMIDNVLEITPSADRAINMAMEHNPPRPDYMPKRLWRLAKIAMIPTTDLVGVLTIGEIPRDIRERFDIPFSKFDEVRLELFRAAIRTSMNRIPDPVKYYPIAYEAYQRERGGKHKNVIDQITHSGITLGTESVKKTVIPMFGRAQSLRSHLPGVAKAA